MLQELDSRREETATVRLLWDDRTEIVWLHMQEDGGAEHVVGVPALEARDAFLSAPRCTSASSRRSLPSAARRSTAPT